METHEYNQIRADLNLSQLAAGRVLGIKPRQAHRIAKGISPVPPPAAKLLRVIVQLKLAPDSVEKL